MRSQAEPFNVHRKGELESRIFMLEPSFYFKVYLCEERHFAAFIFREFLAVSFSGAWRDLQSAVRTNGRVWLQPRKAQRAKKGLVQKPSESCLKAKNYWLVS